MQDMQVWLLGWEDTLEEEMVTHNSVLIWKKSDGQRSLGATDHGVTKNQTWLSDRTHTYIGWGSNLMTSFQLDYLFKDPVSKWGHIVEYCGIGLEHAFLGRHEAII